MSQKHKKNDIHKGEKEIIEDNDYENAQYDILKILSGLKNSIENVEKRLDDMDRNANDRFDDMNTKVDEKFENLNGKLDALQGDVFEI